MSKTVLHVVGARPNFMKVAPIHRAIQALGKLEQRLIHTGQHYDTNMSDVFFAELGLPEPDLSLGIGSGSHAEQTARVMIELERVLGQNRPHLVSVVGDINSTMAAALVCAKMRIPLAHVEAGLRSRDRSMPEEINRLVTDQLADLLLTPSTDANENLRREGIPAERIFFVGNVIIDSLLASRRRAQQLDTLNQLGLRREQYAICTLHRPSNVDDPQTLSSIVCAVAEIAERLPVVFPVHPRTRRRMEESGLAGHGRAPNGLRLVEPMGYLPFLALVSQARLILTDSGGLQEESTTLGVPCLTLRENTERPITVELGTNVLVGTNPERIRTEAAKVLEGKGKTGRIPEKWDGRTGERIAVVFERALGVD
ncbi:MAG TPA: UDP-N-acetylglucosamine 2-epimerase (non-hydrolyzing) [Myxococcaceae bacterium]|nr:UDP-N-acetylglucosamine 2-epimerase (non-hydrolyzing) [Myxococcaceae bacterium]